VIPRASRSRSSVRLGQPFGHKEGQLMTSHGKMQGKNSHTHFDSRSSREHDSK
jgi:hypothetical protein